MLQERVHRRAYHIFQFSSFLRGSMYISFFLHEGKFRALIYLHIITVILLAIVHASHLSFQKVFLTLNIFFTSQDGEFLI